MHKLNTLALTLLALPLYPSNPAATIATAASANEPDVVEFTTPLAGAAQQHPVATLTQTEPAATTAPVVKLDPTAVNIVALVSTIAARPEYKGRHPYTTADSIAEAFKKEWANYNEDTFGGSNGATVVDVVMAQPTMPHAVRCALCILLRSKIQFIARMLDKTSERPKIDYYKDYFALPADPELRILAKNDYEERLKQSNEDTQRLGIQLMAHTPLVQDLTRIIALYYQNPVRWGISLQQAHNHKKIHDPYYTYHQLYHMAICDPRGLEGERFSDLNLSCNGIDLRPQAFQCQLLRSVDLSKNCITEVPEYSFSNQPGLDGRLELSGNFIVSLATHAFTGLRYLTSLDISDNMIDELTMEMLSQLPALHTLNIGGNKLKNIPTEAMLANLRFLYEVNPDENPWGGHEANSTQAQAIAQTIRAQFANRPIPDFDTWKKRDKEEQAKLASAAATGAAQPATTAAASTAATAPVVKPTGS